MSLLESTRSNGDDSIDRLHTAAALRAGYTLEAPVGDGGQKLCYRARSADGNVFAFKIFKPGAVVERSIRELQAMHSCDHPAIARCIDSGNDTIDGERIEYVVEEFFGSGSLSDRIAACDPDVPEAISIGELLIDAIVYLRSKQLVHRDIKPPNIMFRKNSEPILTDFGIVRDLGQASLTETSWPRGLGTYSFMPAEQMYNQKPMIDWRADQFALGITLSLVALRRHPFGNDFQTQLNSIARRQPPTSTFVEAAASAGMHPLIKMVQPYPIQRYSNPEALVKDWRGQRK